MEELSKMPIWLDMFIGVIAAIGGLEGLKYLLSLRAHRDKDNAEAHSAAAEAGQSDADWRQKEFQLMTSIVETTKHQYEEVSQQLQQERKRAEDEKNEDRKIKSKLRVAVAELERKVDGLQRAFTESESRRKNAERFFCSKETCKQRIPPLGKYTSDEKVKKPAVKKKPTTETKK